MKNQPAVFLKLLVLLVPREMEMTHRGGVKALSDEQLEAGIEMIQSMLGGSRRWRIGQGDRRRGRSGASSSPKSKPRRKRKRSLDVVVSDAKPASD